MSTATDHLTAIPQLGHYEIDTGSSTVRGVASPVTLTIEQPAARPASFTARATTRIDRTAFGVSAQRGFAGRFLDVTMGIQCARV